jgi:chloramphenicol 3-O phosphotransferase
MEVVETGSINKTPEVDQMILQNSNDTKSGTILIVNGASSSGKTSILRAFQALCVDPYLDAGLDRFIFMLPKRYLERPLWDDVLGLATSAGATGHQLVLAMHRAIAAVAHCGINVIADHVLVEPAWASDLSKILDGFNAYMIGVRCPLPVLEEREKNRCDRTLGQARAQFERVHAFCRYDMEVDTSLLNPTECAQQILARLQHGPPPFALRNMKLR